MDSDSKASTSASAALVSASAHHSPRASSAKMTPHKPYSSSVGVLGCKINTNRVAYWPRPVSCNNICIQVSYKDRKVYLLYIDTSGGAYNISYDTWNYLGFSKSAIDDPQQGGGIEIEYKTGIDELCSLDLTTSNLPIYSSSLSSQAELGLNVENIEYGTGKKVTAL
ncbi:hypothetical protein EDB80DRAFT_756496 [Ilyonectria destructans]|nr:hypothetical protein EDB80DRAFT_756496 [Ilyonectria destructans]